MCRSAECRKTTRLVFPEIVVAIFCTTVLSLAPETSYAQRGGGGGHFGNPGGYLRGGGRGDIHSSGGTHMTYLRGAGRPSPIVHTGPFLPMIRGPRPQMRPRHLFYPRYGFWPLYGWAATWIPDCGDNAWGPDCRDYGNAHAQEGIELQESGSPADDGGIAFNPVIFYLRDGTGYGATDYWLADGILHFVTTYGTEKSVGLDQLDVQRTVDENAARGVFITLGPSPRGRSAARMPLSTSPTCPPASNDRAGVRPAQPAPGNEAGLFGARGHASESGLKVTSVETGSRAAQVGIHPGDVVLRIDCQQVHSSQDIESAIAANLSGIAWVSYLIKGTWLTDQEIKLR
jgi:hypothetical protein